MASSKSRLAVWELRNAVTTKQHTTNFRHLLPVNKRVVKYRGEGVPGVKTAPAKDRIKWWNIVPGDQIRLVGDSEGTLHEVQRVNKLTNRVLVKSQSVRQLIPLTLYDFLMNFALRHLRMNQSRG